MKSSRRKSLEKAGFKVGSVQEFLKLSEEEIALIELKVSLIKLLKQARMNSQMTQHQLAKLMESSQSRIAKLERCGQDVSLDLICRALFALGISQAKIGKALQVKS